MLSFNGLTSTNVRYDRGIQLLEGVVAMLTKMLRSQTWDADVHDAVAVKVHDHVYVYVYVHVGCLVEGSPTSGQP